MAKDRAEERTFRGPPIEVGEFTETARYSSPDEYYRKRLGAAYRELSGSDAADHHATAMKAYRASVAAHKATLKAHGEEASGDQKAAALAHGVAHERHVQAQEAHEAAFDSAPNQEEQRHHHYFAEFHHNTGARHYDRA